MQDGGGYVLGDGAGGRWVSGVWSMEHPGGTHHGASQGMQGKQMTDTLGFRSQGKGLRVLHLGFKGHHNSAFDYYQASRHSSEASSKEWGGGCLQ